MQLNIVLFEPEIPQNTGNIVRTCAATRAVLHLIEPLGFSVSDKHLKRAGLDYWNSVRIHYYKNFDSFISKFSGFPIYYVSTKAKYVYSDIAYPDECFFVFGKETAGLPENLLKENYESCVRIPMVESIRSLNLSNSVAIVTYEFFRQKGFINFQKQGFIPKKD